MRHLSTETLLDHVDGKISEDARLVVETHLSQCSDCLQARQTLHSLVLQLQQDSSFEPPADLAQWGLNLFQPLLQPASGGKLKKIIAALVFDTYDQPMLAGVRRVGAPSRQLLFRAGDVDVDVKIEAMEATDRITLVGQVLSSTEKFFDNTSVKLESQGIVRYLTLTNVVGEFSFDEVPKDTYHLSLDLPEGEITLFCVHRGNS